MMSAQHSSKSTISSSPPSLDLSTRHILDNFLEQKKKEKALFKHLKSRSSSTSTSNVTTNNSSSASSASSLLGEKKTEVKEIGMTGRYILDLLPRGRSEKGVTDNQEEIEEDEMSLMAQAEALADLERLNGVEPSILNSSLKGEGSDDDTTSDEYNDDNSDAGENRLPHQMDVDSFIRHFGERWQLSQFWYTPEFSYRLARCLYVLLASEDKEAAETAPAESEPNGETKKIGFVCSPTAYVAFRYLYPEMLPQPDRRRNGTKIESYLFDYDERFSLLAPPQHTLPSPGISERFVKYDLNEPLALPSSLERQVDIAVIDPPYLKAETNIKIAQTVNMLLKKENGKILLITGENIAQQACEIYGDEKTGPLRRAEKLAVEHVGLKNEFGVWGNWDGVERFGSLG